MRIKMMRRKPMFGPKLLALFFRKLSLMVGSGVPLVEAIDVIAIGLKPGTPPRMVLEHVSADLKRGQSFADALEVHPHFFTPELIKIVRSAEAAGTLDHALVRIAQAVDDGTLPPGPRPPGPGWPPPPPKPGGRFRRWLHRHMAPPHGMEDVVFEYRVDEHEGPGHPMPPMPPEPPMPPPRPQPANAAPAPDPDAPVRHARELIEGAIRARATDVHLEPLPEGGRIRFRVDGLLREHRRVERAHYDEAVAGLKRLAGLDLAEHRMPQDE
jgi:hypothetical protein